MRNKLIILSVIIISRLLSIYYFGVTEENYVKSSNEWGVLVSILEKYHMFSFRIVDQEIMPTIFMPPLYPIFLYFIKILTPNFGTYILTVQLLQTLFSVISIFYMLKILLIFFSKKISYIGTWIFILFPANIFAISQISSITIQILLITLFFYYFIKIIKTEKNKYLIFFSIISALLILLRGEFFLFYFFTMFFFVLKKKFKVVIASFLITIFLVSPYLVRNYKIFGIITLTKSAGFNLFKGNNPRSTVEGSPMLNLEDIKKLSTKTYEKAINIKKQDKYDLIIDNLYKEEAINFILDNPLRYIKLYFLKLFSFIFFDTNSTYPNYYNFFHIVPKILISITTALGIIFTITKKNLLSFFSLYYCLNAMIFSIFFILPRYSLSLLPIQIILTSVLIEKIDKLIHNQFS
jgi:4-amino-4-deoxy-L-arabinose transferase-like glycosyltransferase